jgi:hypothetical protein
VAEIAKQKGWPLLAGVVWINLATASQIERHHDTDGLVTIRSAPGMEQIAT